MIRRPLSIFIVVCFVAVLLTALLFQLYYAPENSILIAHRGCNYDVQGNTAMAFEKAGGLGYTMVENDIRYTKDNILVVTHDPDIIFKDGTKKNVYDYTYEELLEKPLKNTKTKDDVYLLSFIDFLKICKSYNMFCLIEIKGDMTDEVLNILFNNIDEYYDKSQCEIQTFNLDLLIRAQQMHPEYKFMLTLADEGDWHVCFEYGFDINIRLFEITQELVFEFHSRGLKVAVWTIDSIAGVKRFNRMKVDYILTNVVKP